MKPHADLAGMVRPAASTAAIIAALTFPAQAGDRALIDYIGFSEDGRYFAFEEFGVQDGSGFPFANIYVVDLPADRWVTGTPYRVRLDSEDADVDEAREAALEQAETKLDELEIFVAVDEIAHNGDGETSDGHSLSYGAPGYGLEPPRDVRMLEIETFHADSPEDCETYIGEPALGFALYLDGDEIARDVGDLPRSRGCPLDYRIYAVVRPPDWAVSDTVDLAVIAVYPFGFEGPDRRFIIVPLDR